MWRAMTGHHVLVPSVEFKGDLPAVIGRSSEGYLSVRAKRIKLLGRVEPFFALLIRRDIINRMLKLVQLRLVLLDHPYKRIFVLCGYKLLIRH